MSGLSFVLNWRRLFTGILALLFLFPAAGVFAADIMPVDQVKTGMRGIAKTVVTGNTIEEFGVEVLGIMKDKGPSGDLILVRVSGDLIDRTGGIAQGMSGSPVYIDGKLVGAIAYGWSLTDHKVGMVTPIQDMMKIWDLSAASNVPFAQQVAEELQPIATPLMAAGFSEQAMNMLKEKLKPLNFVPYAVGAASDDSAPEPLQPGSAVGVELVRGDISLGALGTVTYVEGDKVLAFGHPFMKKGNTNLFMTNANIYTTVSGLENSFKVGTTGQMVGLINQDRGAGVAGVTGRYPVIVPMRIMVHDNSTGNSRDAAVQIVQDEQLTPVLAASTVFSVIDKTLDRVGAGTARVSFEISGNQAPVQSLKRENMFYTAGNIGELAIAELHEALTTILSNQYNPVDIMDVKVNIGIDSERKTAAITEARAAVAAARPGDTVPITVTLKPFRGEPITRVVNFVVPKNQPAGPLTLEVRGGGMVPLLYILKGQGMDSELIKLTKKQQSFAETVAELTNRDRNNDLVVEPIDMNFEGLAEGGMMPQAGKIKKPSVELEPQLAQLAKKGNDNKNKYFTTTDYIIENDTQIMLQIVTEEKK